MYDDELKRVGKKISKMVQKGMFSGKKIYIFGVSDNTRQIIGMLRKHNLEPTYILDNDKTKQYSYCSRIQVLPLEEITDIANDNNMFIIYSAYWREMEAQLRHNQVKQQSICLMVLKKDTLLKHFVYAYKGKRIYDSILKKYATNQVFLCPYTGTGDIYLIGTFWKQYLQKEQIDRYAFVVVSGACKKAAMLFDIENIEVLKIKKECYYLLSYYMLCPNKVNIKILNDCWAQVHTNPIEWFRGYKGLEFTELFRRYVFDLPDCAKPEHPVLKDVEDVERIFKEKQLLPGKTIILSPYANTLADLPDEFWVTLAKCLKDEGYVICTNSSGEDEPAIQGTIPIFFPLNIAPQFVDKAGYFIGVRSGFCDIISGTSTKKVILYDVHNRFYNGSAFEYFSLKRMGLCDDALEIEFESKEVFACIEQIIKAIVS